MPKVGIAYRAYRWFRFVRRHRIIFTARQLRKIRKMIRLIVKEVEENGMDSIKGALLSKLVWLGIGQIVWGLAQIYLSGGTFEPGAVTTAVLGIVTILFRAVTNKPLTEKTSLL